MDNIFEQLNSIDDEQSLTPSINLSDVLKYATIVIVDDARRYNIQAIVDEFAKDHSDEEPVTEAYFKKNKQEHIIVTKKDLENVLKKVSKCTYFDVKGDRPKNKEFLEEHELTDEDVASIVKQLSTTDYCYTLVSNNKFHKGALLHVFISGKEFKLKTRIIKNIAMYIKFEYTTEGVVCVVSIHTPDYTEEYPYKETN